MSNGYRTLSQHLNDLKKENFSLKLRIYFLEERMQQKCEAGREDVYKRVSAGRARGERGAPAGPGAHRYSRRRARSCSRPAPCARAGEAGASAARPWPGPAHLARACWSPFSL